MSESDKKLQTPEGLRKWTNWMLSAGAVALATGSLLSILAISRGKVFDFGSVMIVAGIFLIMAAKAHTEATYLGVKELQKQIEALSEKLDKLQKQ